MKLLTINGNSITRKQERKGIICLNIVRNDVLTTVKMAILVFWVGNRYNVSEKNTVSIFRDSHEHGDKSYNPEDQHQNA
jgi:hypothetical protein